MLTGPGSLLLLWTLTINDVRANIGGGELLRNADFEGSFDGNWYCSSCTLERSTDARNGQGAGKVTGRTRRTGCLRQDVQITGQKRLYFIANMKLLNVLDSQNGERLETYVIVKSTSGSIKTIRFGKVNYVFPSNGYVEVGGDFLTPADTQSITLMVLTYARDLQYVVDDTSLTEVEVDSGWVDKANQRIEQLRKGDITINYNIGSQYDPSQVRVSIDHRRHDFMFGVAISAGRMFATDELNKRYQNYVYSMSNTVTITNAMKWRFMETTEGHPYYATVDKAVEAVKAHNVSVRGHCLAWAKEDRIPAWLKDKSQAEIEAAVNRRFKDMGEHYKGKFIQYDVNNENLHGFWYESKSTNPEFTYDMIKKIHSYDPDTVLCLNDYNVVASGMFTMAYKDQALSMLEHNVPISCMGVQSHFFEQPVPEAMKKRLDTLAEAGLKIYITEMDYLQTDQALRAKGFEDAMRMFFSHPAVHGIIIWGPWDQDNGNLPAAIVEGNDFRDNASGQKVKALLNGAWRTNEVLTPSSRTGSETVRGFYGGYDVTVEYNGQVKSTGSFYLATDHTATFDVTLQ